MSEKTAVTANKVLQNVHEPIDSTITENRIHWLRQLLFSILF